MKKTLPISPLVSVVICILINLSEAIAVSQNSNEKTVSIEYLTPTEKSRDIRTINVNYGFFLTEVDKLNLPIYVGFTATYATGNITQLEGSLESGTLREVHYDNSAFGLGPVLWNNIRLGGNNRLSISLDGSGGLIVYHKEFPAGGAHYNFMWRGGPALRYDIDKSKSLDVGYLWAHVSNGQGIGAQNPSYNAGGITLRFTGFF